jgi:hypothetical protein
LSVGRVFADNLTVTRRAASRSLPVLADEFVALRWHLDGIA